MEKKVKRGERNEREREKERKNTERIQVAMAGEVKGEGRGD